MRHQHSLLWIILLFVMPMVQALCASSATEAITDEKLRRIALSVLFPGMSVSPEPGKRIDDSGPKEASRPQRIFYPDALAREAVYRVVGRATNEAERCASENLLAQSFSDQREVRLKVFWWPGKAGTELLTLVQYNFPSASPAGSCWSIGLLTHLVLHGQAWQRREDYLLDMHHHSSIQRVELVDLGGAGLPELVVESSGGGGGVADGTLQVFSLRSRGFEEILKTFCRMEAATDEMYVQKLDIAGTRAERAKRFRLTKTTFVEAGRWLTPPRVTSETYERGSGVEPGSKGNQHWLTPLN